MSTFEIPRPPSVNEMYANLPGKGRIKSRVYKKWIEAAGWELKLQRPKPVDGKYLLIVEIGPTRADIDNLAKGLNDLLQRHQLVSNDRMAGEVRLRRCETVDTGMVRCTLAPLNPDQGWVALGETDAVKRFAGGAA